ncbi:MAG: class I SAM-dependent methyltransferase [Rhodococcus sp. (in: high G+C Gram-positive bacteria)]|uniref:class I SAM-dependent methyltransferase n=1 Tax=Rhodococcus sp. TaxID=1831 RepID=UPI003BB71907
MSGGPGSGIDWDVHAPMYTIMSDLEADATELQVGVIPLLSTDTVLDIGCGPGRVTIPVARRVARVTALDSFPLMLDACRRRAAEAGADNIDFVALDWHDARPGVNLDRHDVVICSRTAALGDIERVSEFATRIAAVITWANAPSIPPILDRLFADTGTEELSASGRPDRSQGYKQLFGTAYDLGYEPNVAVVPDGFTRTYPDREHVYDHLRPLRPIPPGRDAERAFRANIDAFTVENPDGTVTFEVTTRSVVLWWQVG